MQVLILGGTGDATALATHLLQLPGVTVTSSLAGRTLQPSAPVGMIRIGGFGGSNGLATYLQEHCIDLLIDATHPFAAQISWHAAAAATTVGLPHLMLVRPEWQKIVGDRWLEVETVEAAAQAMPKSAKRVFLTIGRQQLAPFAPITDRWFLMRSIDPPAADLPLPSGELLLDRGPFTLDSERDLLKKYEIDAIVSKNSGGDATYAKIMAARELGLPIVMVQRPPMPQGDRVADVPSAVAWVKQRL